MNDILFIFIAINSAFIFVGLIGAIGLSIIEKDFSDVTEILKNIGTLILILNIIGVLLWLFYQYITWLAVL